MIYVLTIFAIVLCLYLIVSKILSIKDITKENAASSSMQIFTLCLLLSLLFVFVIKSRLIDLNQNDYNNDGVLIMVLK